MLTVACVWVSANVPYRLVYVQRLRSMVERWMDRPYRFVCLTDRPWRVPDVATIPVPTPQPLAGWWSKVELFNRAHAFGDRVLYLDLDTLIVAPLAPLIDYPSPFALVPHAGTFTGKDGKTIVPRFNSSVMVWDRGVPDRLHAAWTPAVAERLWGDQDWIGERMPQADTMPAAWFPRLSDLHGEPPPPEARVVLAKKPKCEQAAQRWPWVREVWA